MKKKSISPSKVVYFLLFLSVAFYMIALLYIYLGQSSLMYHPSPEVYGLSHYNINNAKEIVLTAEDGTKIQAWYRAPEKKCDMVVFLHGNSGNLDERADKLQELARMGYGFIIPAWRGFGKSEGTPSLEGLYQDARSAIDYLKSMGYQTEDLLMIGESLGTGIATQMASENRFKGVFLITPYTSIADRSGEMYPYFKFFIPYMLNDNYEVLSKIHGIKQPLLIIHGTHDTMIPIHHAEKVFEAAHQPKKIVIYPGIEHTNYDIHAVFTEMRNFFGAS